MSRRTRLGFLALFLGLTAVPMVYLFLTWAPEDPLRFRLTRASGQAHAAIPLYEVEITNTRGVPIRLHDGTLWMHYGSAWDSQPGAILPGRERFFAQLDIDATVHGWSSTPGSAGRRPKAAPIYYRLHSTRSITIPSHGTRRIPIRILDGPGLIPQEGELRIRYTWISMPRDLTRRMASSLRRHLPDPWQPRLPTLTPEDTTAIVEFHRVDLAPIHPTAGQGRVASTATSTSTR